ncbi:MAG: hypothetical protein KKI09_07775 [Spirochaetes bacterium]|nr:hypothetical protein [Spirochaetota bacterium]MBU0955310.1 hypothetical protein [Spirochaetota bacterium]
MTSETKKNIRDIIAGAVLAILLSNIVATRFVIFARVNRAFRPILQALKGYLTVITKYDCLHLSILK